MKNWLISAALVSFMVAGFSRANAACAPTPQTGCKLTSGRHETWMTYFQTRRTDPDDVYTWAWHGGSETTAADFGNPSTTAYAFCIYDSSDRPQPVVATAANQDPSNWKTLDNGFLFRRRGDQPLRKLILRAKVGGTGKILAHGDSTTEAQVLPFVAPVIVQMQEANGSCWESDFTTPLRNDAHVFRIE